MRISAPPLSSLSPGAQCLGLLADLFEHMRPALRHPAFVILGNETERGVAESDQSSVILRAQPILHIVEDRR